MPPPKATDNFCEEYMDQKAVYWEPAGTSKSGNTIYNTPIEIDCRFVRSGQMKLATMSGEISSSMDEYMVDRDLKEDGYLRPGPMPAPPLGIDPTALNVFGKVIRIFKSTPSTDAQTFVRRAFVEKARKQ